MDRWAGKVAVVTGASAGIGAAIVVDLVKAGMIVVGLARRKDRVEQLQSQIPTDVAGKLYAVQCDVSDDSSVVETFKWISIEFGAIHVLINNAGIGGGGGAITDEGNEEYIKSIIQTNLWGLVLCTKQSVEIMKREKVTGAHIININSKLGYKVSYVNTTSRPFWSVYPASKFAVTALTEVLRQEFNNDNFQFRVTNISPGVVRTDIWPNESIFDHVPYILPNDVSQSVLYALGAPPHVNVSDVIVQPIGEIL